MKKIFYLTTILFLTSIGAYAQQGFGTSNPDQSAVVDMKAGNKGVLFPRVALTGLTDITTIAAPANALTVFNTADAGTAPNIILPGYYYWNTTASKWVRILNSGDAWSLNGNAGTAAAGSYLGTTDGSPLIFKLNGILSGYLSNSSTGFGYGTLAKPGSYNVAIGRNSLSTPSFNGSSNTTVGNDNMSNAATASNNVAIGAIALFQNTTGNDNVAVGYEASRHIGSASDNVAIGSGTLRNRYGSQNTALGKESLGGPVSAVNSSGNGMVAIGYRAGYNEGLSNKLYIANSSTTLPLVYGTFANDGGNLTINNSNASNTTAKAPANSSTLNVNGSVSASIVTISADYTVTDQDYTIVVRNSGSNNINITFPSASTAKGRIYKIIAHPATNSATFTLVGVMSLGGINQTANSGNTATGWGKYEIQSDGADWLIINAL
ncbi:hypothetical protein [uncultured Pedobacter sp.]|uniref:hypothetical protein n=1 Tax=uncultured Pedobacter sp. TaxID=246139 RepID=UPI0025D4327A|nr:hypothetical protein [uncultured Pedobacter sp.]